MNMLVATGGAVVYDSDESRFEREKFMLVLCPNANPGKSSKILLIDIDYQSKSYCLVNSILQHKKILSF